MSKKELKSNDPFRHKYSVFKCACKRRGTPICEEWLESFESFKDFLVSNHWEKGKDLQRSDLTQPYSPSNCIVTERGNPNLQVRELCKKYGLNKGTVRQRIQNGWTEKDFENKGKSSYNPHDMSKHKKYFGMYPSEIAKKFNLPVTVVTGRLRCGWTLKDFNKGYRTYNGPKSKAYILSKKDYFYKTENFYYAQKKMPLSETEVQALGLVLDNHCIYVLLNDNTPIGFIHFSIDKGKVFIEHGEGNIKPLFIKLKKSRPDSSFSMSIKMKKFYLEFQEIFHREV